MPIPTCHLVRKEYIYTADDGQQYRRKFEAALITAIGSSMGVPVWEPEIYQDFHGISNRDTSISKLQTVLMPMEIQKNTVESVL